MTLCHHSFTETKLKRHYAKTCRSDFFFIIFLKIYPLYRLTKPIRLFLHRFFCIFVQSAIMDSVDIDINKRYTFADYLTWWDDKRRELINGFVKMMTPAPSRRHQRILGEIHFQIKSFLKKKKCEVYVAPFDVRFPSSDNNVADNQIYTVVQPDICIICDESKLDDKGCLGAPDLIIEIVSLSTVKKDVEEKFNLYEESGVKEYWIVQPNDETVTVFHLENGKYQHKGIYTRGSKVEVGIFKGKLDIDLDDVFFTK
jgi:Uma2 family endonuclease